MCGKCCIWIELAYQVGSILPDISCLNVQKCIGDLVSILPLEVLGVEENLTYEEVPFEILEEQVKRLKNKDVAYVKVQWRNHLVESPTLEVEADMISCYPSFPSYFYSNWGN